MAEQFISIGDMVKHMNAGLPFSILFVTYDKASGRGGAVKQIDMATKCWPKDLDQQKAANPGTWDRGRFEKNPNHFNNSTVNIRVSAAGQADIRKVHIQLIRRFNGAIVK